MATRLLTKGSGVFGALGGGDWSRRAALGAVVNDATCRAGRGAVAAGWGHTAWCSDEGRVFVTGETSRQQYITYGGAAERTAPLLAWLGARFVRGSAASATPREVQLPAGSAAAVEVAASACLTLVRTEDGAVYAFGANESGQCGAGVAHEPTLWPPRRVQNIDLTTRRVAQLAAGLKHGAAVTERGELLIWGANSSGQLGTGTTVARSSAHAVEEAAFNGSRVLRVAAGVAHTALVTEDGGAFVWGKDMSDGTKLDARRCVVDQLEPRAIELVGADGRARRALDVSCTAFGTAFLTDDGGVHMVGRGRSSQKKLTWSSWIRQVFPRRGDEKAKEAELEAAAAEAEDEQLGRVVRGANRVTVAPWTAPTTLDRDGGGCGASVSLRGGFDCVYTVSDAGHVMQYALGEMPIAMEGIEELCVDDLSVGWLHTVLTASPRGTVEQDAV